MKSDRDHLCMALPDKSLPGFSCLPSYRYQASRPHNQGEDARARAKRGSLERCEGSYSLLTDHATVDAIAIDQPASVPGTKVTVVFACPDHCSCSDDTRDLRYNPW